MQNYNNTLLYTHTGMGIIKTTDDNKCYQDSEKLEHFVHGWCDYINGTTLRETVLRSTESQTWSYDMIQQFHSQIYIHKNYKPEPRRNENIPTQKRVHACSQWYIHNSPKVETTQMAIN